MDGRQAVLAGEDIFTVGPCSLVIYRSG